MHPKFRGVESRGVSRNGMKNSRPAYGREIEILRVGRSRKENVKRMKDLGCKKAAIGYGERTDCLIDPSWGRKSKKGEKVSGKEQTKRQSNSPKVRTSRPERQKGTWKRAQLKLK